MSPTVSGSGSNGFTTGNYILNLTDLGNLSAAPTLTLGAAASTLTQAGELTTPNQVLLYQVQVQAGNAVQAFVTTPAGSNLSSALNILDSTGKRGFAVSTSVDGSGDQSVAFRASTTGTYYLTVSSNGFDGDNTGSFCSQPDQRGLPHTIPWQPPHP